MQRHEFSGSSNIRAVTFDDKSGIVEVEFKSGKSHRFAEFTAAEFGEWCAAKSAGGWFYANVRKDAKRHPEIPETIPELAEVTCTMPGTTAFRLSPDDRVEVETPAAERVARTDRELTIEPGAPIAPMPKHYRDALARARASRKPRS